MYHIIWPKNPDTDSICSALVAAEYFRLIGQDATPYYQGELSDKTVSTFHELGIEPPECITSLPAGSEIVLVDHNDFTRAIDGIENMKLRGIIDHHACNNLTTSGPIQLRFEPLCSTCSILFLMFAEQELEMSDPIAQLILAGIMSESRDLTAPTTTDEDREIVEYLVEDLGGEAAS